MHNQQFKTRITLLILLFFTSFSQLTLAQGKSPYSLLWKIEGKDTKEPSYLFGTMHVDDVRAFNFSDAVMPAMESTKYFALEIDPDSLMIAYTNLKYDVTANEFYKKLLDPNDYKRLLNRFEEVNDYSLEDSEIMSPDLVLSMLIPDDDKEDDKSTFVDMYLLGHARTMNKDIVGLEDIDDQISYFDNLSDENKIRQVLDNLDIEVDSIRRTKEIMTTIYESGDLNKIEEFVKRYDLSSTNMISRNKVMKNSIINFMKKGSIFAGIGAAHLVCKESVIELLQNEGYTVTVVDATFTGVADTYKIDPSKGPWYYHMDNDLGYYLEIPNEPNIEEGNDSFSVYGYSDISTKTTYLFMGLDLGYELEESQRDTLMEKMISNMMDKRESKILTKQKIEDEEIFGYNVTSQMPKNVLMKSRFILKNNHFYYFSVETSKRQIEENYVDRYLNSIIVKGVEKHIDTSKWREFKSKKGAFSIKIPAEPKDLSREYPNPLEPEGEPYFLNLYMSMDIENKNNYLFRYNNQPTGYYLESPDLAFKSTEETLTQKATLVSEPKVIYLNGMEGREYELKISDKYHSIARVYFRGNRTYLLLKQKISTTEKVTTDDLFFNSFKMLPYEQTPLKAYSPSDKSFDIKLFETVTEDIDSLDYESSQVVDSHDYASVNPATGGVYQFGYSNVRKYFRTSTYKAFLDLYKNNDLAYNDSIIKEQIYIKNGDSIIEFAVKSKPFIDTKQQRITRIWLNNNRVQVAKAVVSDEEANSGIVQEVFNSIKMKPAKTNYDVLESKAELIFNDLKSKDSLTYNLALSTFDYYEFDKYDLPHLIDGLNYDYTEEKNKIIKPKIIYEFTLIDDASALKVLEDLYNNPETSDMIKATIISSIPEIESTDNLSLYSKLLFSNPPIEKDSYSYEILQPFKDSLNYALENYSSLIKLMPYVQYRGDIINISTNIITSEVDNNALVLDNQDKIIEYIKTDVDDFFKLSEEETETDEIYSSLMYDYLYYLNKVKTSNAHCDNITSTILNSDKDRWMKLQALLARIFNDYPIEKKVINKYLEDLYFRFEIIEAYHKKNELSAIDKKYLKPKEFAKLSFYNNIGEENGYPDFIDITKSITKEKQEFYVVKFSYKPEEDQDEDESIEYIGIVGPLKNLSQATDIKMFDSITYWETFDDQWEEKANTLIKNYLEYE